MLCPADLRVARSGLLEFLAPEGDSSVQTGLMSSGDVAPHLPTAGTCLSSLVSAYFPLRDQNLRESFGVRLLRSCAAHLGRHHQEERSNPGGAVLWLASGRYGHGN